MSRAETTWFKPSDRENILFTKTSGTDIFQIRSLWLPTDLDTLHQWVNEEYSRRFWQMNGSKKVLADTYTTVLNNPAAHSFIVLANERMVAQVDLYIAQTDEISKHITAEANDCGLHLLMLPPKESHKGLSKAVLCCFIAFYFSHPSAGTLYAEPDKENYHANRLAINAGFRFIKTVVLSNKTANLYSLTREQFHQ